MSRADELLADVLRDLSLNSFLKLNDHLKEGGELPEAWKNAKAAGEGRGVIREVFGADRLRIPSDGLKTLDLTGGVALVRVDDIAAALSYIGMRESFASDTAFGRLSAVLPPPDPKYTHALGDGCPHEQAVPLPVGVPIEPERTVVFTADLEAALLELSGTSLDGEVRERLQGAAAYARGRA